MSPEEIRSQLDRLERAAGYHALRFDGHQPLGGRVAVLSSAFNPPTLAHFAILEAARAIDDIGAVAAMLTTRNVAKDVHGAPLEHRVGMLLAEAPRAGFAVLTTNAARFVDQAAALTASVAATAFDFVAGYDTLIRLFDTRYYAEGAMRAELEHFFAAHRLIAVNRAGFGPPEIAAFLDQPGVRPFAHRIIVSEIEGSLAALSSTASRDALAAGASAPLSESVRSYIRQHRLYGASGPDR